MRHENGAAVCTIYGSAAKMSVCGFGPTIAFNLKRADGAWVGYREVEKLASLSGIQLRTGCFCNPGACSKHLRLSHADILSNIEAGHVCWDDNDILGGKPTGAVRISFGYMSTFEDAKEFIDFIVKSFVSTPNPAEKGCLSETNLRKFLSNSIYLKSITIYPIKSCKGFSADSWLLSDSGLLHDREWVLKSPSGEILTQKKVPEMSLISTSIDLSQGMLFVESPGCGEKLSINLEQCYGPKEEIMTQSQRFEVHGYSDDINLWFSKAISRPCSLFKCVDSQLCSFGNMGVSTGMCRDVQSQLSFVNEAQFLLISEESVSDLNMRISSKERENGNTGEPILVSPMRFRPNLVISGAPPYAEDNWRRLSIGKAQFKSIGGCNRCQMINLDPLSELTLKSKEPLKTLASYRRTKGKILFGIMLRHDKGLKDDMQQLQLQVGQRVYPS